MSTVQARSSALWVFAAVAAGASLSGRAALGFDDSLQAFFGQYCFDCHADGAGEGGLELDKLGSDLGDVATFAKWERVYDRVGAGEMPPADYEQPSDEQREAFAKALGEPLTKAHAARKGTVLRRLNRREYQNTMNDLFGTDLDLESMLPEDNRSHEFDNVGEALSISLVQLQRYMEAADLVLDASIAKSTSRPEASTKRANYAETREGEKHIGKAWKQAEDGAVVFFRPLGYPSGMLRTAGVRQTGRYRIRVTGYAYQSDKPVTFKVGGTSFQRGSQKPTFGYFSFPPGKPTTIEFEAKIEKNFMIEITPWGISDKENEIRKSGVNSYKGPGLAISQVELEGPIIDEYPTRGHQLIFEGLDRREIEPRNPNDKKRPWYEPKFEIVSDNPQRDATTALTRIATVALRRPTGAKEIVDYLDLFDSQMAGGATMEEALRAAVVAIFSSPDFLYLSEAEGWLDDYAIAKQQPMYDMIVLALQTDSTRTITFQLSGMNAVPTIQGVSSDWHGLSHHGKDPAKIDELKIIEQAEFVAFNNFLTGLRGIEENGQSLLDHTAILFGSNLGNASSHDWHNLPIILAGGGFKHGAYVAHDMKNNTPLANLFVPLAQRMGLEIDRFGSSTAVGLRGLDV